VLEGKKAVVTGAAQGIGQAIAEMLAQAGADVVVADLDATRCQDTVDRVKKHKRKALAVSTNVAQWDDVKAMVDQVVKDWGRIDIFVNNAGITRDGLVVRMKEEDWNVVIQVNLTGTFYCTKATLGPMSKQRYYAASKAAVIGLTKTIAREYASRNITVNAVAPGFINTAMTQGLGENVREMLSKQIPLGRLGEPSDIAEAVRFLASDAASYITGQVLHVNGGLHMA